MGETYRLDMIYSYTPYHYKATMYRRRIVLKLTPYERFCKEHWQ
jgi:hypothetical protein